MRIRVHADDLGISRGVTDGILECVDHGPVDGVSVIATGVAFDYAMAELRRRPHVTPSVHLNLIEGRPVAPASKLDLLVDGEGFLHHSFPSLWRNHAMASAATRVRLEAQVRLELRAQAAKVREALGGARTLRLDSHQHLHHIPFVFRIAADLCRDLPAAGMRLVREPFFMARGSLGPHLGSGMAKHWLLNTLAGRHRAAASSREVPRDDWFVGALLTGRMSAAAVNTALRRVHERAFPGQDVSVEIVFHPGSALPGEESVWARYPALRAYYFSPWRRRESESLRSAEMAACLARWRSTGDVGAPPPRKGGP